MYIGFLEITSLDKADKTSQIKITAAQKLLTVFPVAGTLTFPLSSLFFPPPLGRSSTWSQRQSDGVVTVTMSPFNVNTLCKVKKTVVKHIPQENNTNIN